MSSIFEDFERELVNAARQQAGRQPSHNRPRRRSPVQALKAVPAVAVIAGCLIVVVFAATSLHGRSKATHGSLAVTGRRSTISTATQPAGALQQAPDYLRQLRVLAGAKAKTKSLASYRGKFVLVNFFASWCEPCKTEAPVLAAAQKLLGAHNGTVLGVAYQDNSARALAFVRAYRLDYPVLSDDHRGDFARAYGLSGVPDSYLINRQGKVVWERLYGLTPSFVTHTLPRLIAENNSHGPANTGHLGAGKLTLESTSAAFDKAAGVFTLRRQDTQNDLVVTASHLPPHTKDDAYAVWLANSDGADMFLGYVATGPKHGRLQAETRVSSTAAERYQFVELTIQHGSGGPSPHIGYVILRGELP